MVGWRASKTRLIFWKRYYLSPRAYVILYQTQVSKAHSSTVHLCFAGVWNKLLTRAHRFLPPSCCDKCLGSLWRSHICVSVFKKNNPLEIFLTNRNSLWCSEVVNIRPRKDIAYKRTRVFTLNWWNLFACKSWKQFMTRYTTRQTVLSHDIMGDTRCMTFVRTFAEEYGLFCTIEFFQPCVGKRKTIQERSVHLLCKCRHSTTWELILQVKYV